MEILEEITQTQSIINELLDNLYPASSEEKPPLEKYLPSKELHKLNYLVGTHKKLQEDEHYSLSDKGLENYREESKSLIAFLEPIVQKRDSDYIAAKNGNRLFNYKTHILNWKDPVTWPTVTFHSLALALGACGAAIVFLALYRITDSNNLIFIAILFSAIMLYSSVPDKITDTIEEPVSNKFAIVSANFLLWKSAYKLLPFVIAGVGIVKLKAYWADDIILILSFGLPLAMLLTCMKCEDWLEDAYNIENNKQPLKDE